MTQQERVKHRVNLTGYELTTYLIKDFDLVIAEALDIVYSSKTLELLQNKRTGLYDQSPGYVYHLLKHEYKTGQLPQVN